LGMGGRNDLMQVRKLESIIVAKTEPDWDHDSLLDLIGRFHYDLHLYP